MEVRRLVLLKNVVIYFISCLLWVNPTLIYSSTCTCTPKPLNCFLHFVLHSAFD